MRYENSKRSIYTPIVLALFLIIGIYIGNKLIPSKVIYANYTSGKISALLNLVNENYVNDVKTDSLEEIAIPKILEALDPHTVYIPAKDLKETNARLVGNFEGIGIQFNIHDDTLIIINTISGGPSEKLGVLAGDRIVTIDDSLFAGVGITNDDVIKKLKGEKGSIVKIGVKRHGIKDLIHFSIKRDKIPLLSVDVSYMINNNTGYIKISKFSVSTYQEFIKATKELLNNGMTNMILDLRQNGGGYLKAATDIADEFLPAGKLIVYTKDKYNRKSEYVASRKGLCKNIGLAVLIDSWSASASEVVAGALQDNDRGTIIGRRSFGKGLVQETFTFSDESAVRLTTARYYTPTGRCIQKSYKKGQEAYFADIYHRIAGGELKSADSIKINDSLKFTTPKGKVVYGGGGIIPEIFVPIDTVGFSDSYDKIVTKGLIYKYALDYADANREELTKLKDYKEINSYLLNHNVYGSFLKYLDSQKIKTKANEMDISKDVISTKLRAYIARNIINDIGYYPIIRDIDNVLKKAVKSFE